MCGGAVQDFSRGRCGEGRGGRLTMKKIEYIPKFTVSGKAMRLIMEIAAALERYKIVMEGPDGVRLRKLNQIGR